MVCDLGRGSGYNFCGIFVFADSDIFRRYHCLGMVSYIGTNFDWNGKYTLVYARKYYEKADPTQRYLDYAAYVMFGLCGFMFCVIIFCYKSRKLCIAIYKTTA